MNCKLQNKTRDKENNFQRLHDLQDLVHLIYLKSCYNLSRLTSLKIKTIYRFHGEDR